MFFIEDKQIKRLVKQVSPTDAEDIEENIVEIEEEPKEEPIEKPVKDPMTYDDWKVLKMINALDEVPKYIKGTQTPTGYRYSYRLPRGIVYDSLKNNIECIQNILKRRIRLFNLGFGEFTIETIPTQYKPISFEFEQVANLEGMKFNIGQDLQGNKIILDLDTNENCHTLIGGCTRQGKTSLLKLIVTQCITKQVETYILNGKSNDFKVFNNQPNVHCFISGIEATLYKLCNKMTQREKDMQENQTPILVIIDEFADFKKNDKTYKNISHLLRRGGSSKIYVIITTQTGQTDTLDTSIKNNLMNRIAFLCNTEEASESILGKMNHSASKIFCKTGTRGIAIIKTPTQDSIEFHSHFLKDDKIISFLNQFKVETTNSNEPDLKKEEVASALTPIQKQKTNEVLQMIINEIPYFKSDIEYPFYRTNLFTKTDKKKAVPILALRFNDILILTPNFKNKYGISSNEFKNNLKQMPYYNSDNKSTGYKHLNTSERKNIKSLWLNMKELEDNGIKLDILQPIIENKQ